MPENLRGYFLTHTVVLFVYSPCRPTVSANGLGISRGFAMFPNKIARGVATGVYRYI